MIHDGCVPTKSVQSTHRFPYTKSCKLPTIGGGGGINGTRVYETI